MTSRRAVDQASGSELLVGIDIGTTFCKAAVVGLDGVERAHGKSFTPWQPVATGAEIDPVAVVDAVLAACRDALTGVPGRVVGVGVTSMAETGVLIGADGRPAAPAIAWHDTRGEGEARLMAARLGPMEFVARTGLRVSRTPTAAKVSWQLAHVPETRRAVRWLGIAEWMVRQLGGDEAAEYSLASRTGWLDRSGRKWWHDALVASGAPEGLPAPLIEAGAPLGRVRTGLDRLSGAELTVGGHDHLCAAVGAGAVDAGDVLNSCGSAEAFLRAVDPELTAEEVVAAVARGVTVGWHVLPGKGALMGGFESGLVMKRTLEKLRMTVEDLETAHAKEKGAPEIWLATLEALARKGLRILDALVATAGPWERLVVTGGAVQSDTVRSVKRRMFGPFVMAEVGEAGARGAALFAGCAAGIFRSIEAAPQL